MRPMTNKEAAEIIRTVFNSMVYPRACVKSSLMMKRCEAFMKAITLLENTPENTSGTFSKDQEGV